MAVIKNFPNHSYLEYAPGSFDEWCVYMVSADGRRRPPKDTDYFQFIKDMAQKHSAAKVYKDFIDIYNCTGGSVAPDVLSYITQVANSYGEDALAMDQVLTILYMAMIAEENKANTRLGKRIKRLGIYILLFENNDVSYAANFMRGMGWREIDAMCQERGF